MEYPEGLWTVKQSLCGCVSPAGLCSEAEHCVCAKVRSHTQTQHQTALSDQLLPVRASAVMGCSQLQQINNSENTSGRRYNQGDDILSSSHMNLCFLQHLARQSEACCSTGSMPIWGPDIRFQLSTVHEGQWWRCSLKLSHCSACAPGGR